MTWQAWVTVAIIMMALGLFVSERMRIDLVALLVLALLLVFGILDTTEALSGFSNGATITVAAMFALSLGIDRSGALEPLMRIFVRIKSTWLLALAFMVVCAPISAFMNNTTVVATFLPLVLRVCERTGTPPGRVLIPMAFATQMGGVGTLLGTSSNLLTDSIARQHGLEGFGVFEFTQLGVVLTVAGILYLMVFGRLVLPKDTDASKPAEAALGKYVVELKVVADSHLLGHTIAEAGLGEKYGVFPLELLRGDRHMWSPRSQTLEEGDILLVRGDWDKIVDFRKRTGLQDASGNRNEEGDKKQRLLVEIMVAPGSTIEGRTLKDLDFRWRYDAVALAIHRRGHILREKLSSISLQVGDVLLMLVNEPAMDRLRADGRLVVLSEREEASHTPRRALIAVGIMIAVVVTAALGALTIPAAAICGAVAMALTGCFGRRDAYSGIDWKIIVLLGAILPLGIAMEKTGLSAILVQGGLTLVGEHGPMAGLLMVYLLTGLLTEMMGHNPTVVLMGGIAISVAHTLGADPRPFLVAVAFAASTSFATPVGYQTNAMVYYAGGYRFTDFMKAGIPLIALFCFLSMLLIPVFWPLHPGG